MSMMNNVKNPKQVFIINGSGGVGKDLFVNMVKTSVSKFSPYRVWNYSSIDKVKAIATQIGWSGGKTEKDRKFLSDLKLLTTEYNDMAFEDLKRMVNIFEEQKDVADGGVFNYHYDTIIKNNDTKEMLQGMADLFTQDWLFEENE